MVEIPIRVRVSGNYQEAATRIDALREAVNAAWVSATHDSVDYIHDFADAEIRRITGGGNYWHMDQDTTVTGPGSASGHVITHPSGEHEINAKPGGALAFFWERKGIDVVTKKVNHPGSNPVDWVSQMPEGAQRIPSIYRRKLSDAWRTMGVG